MDEPSVILRFAIPEDYPFIYASWRNACFYGAKKPQTQPAKIFFKKQTLKIKEILKSAQTMIACLSDDPDLIIGYSVATGSNLDFIYVKADYRSKGIGTLLMPKNIDTVTNELTKIGLVLAEKKKLKIKENEYAQGNPESAIHKNT